MKVSLLTPINKDTSVPWGKDLVHILNKNGVQAKHIHSLPMLLKSCFYQDANIVHTTVPIPIKLWKKPIVLTMHGDYSLEQNIWQRSVPSQAIFYLRRLRYVVWLAPTS